VVDRHLVLIGSAGVGKTTAGRQLATNLHLEFLDTDAVLAETVAMSAREYFRTHQEPAFRARESEVCARLLQSPDRAVIALAAGAVLDSDTQQLLRKRADVAWLFAPLEVLRDRVASDPGGRLLSNEMEARTRAREPIYRRLANVVIDTTNRSPEIVAHEVEGAVTQLSQGIECDPVTVAR
jgi:shikimate kinase